MSLEVQKVSHFWEMQEFLHFPWRVYENDPLWVPPLYHERAAFFNKHRNPFFHHSEVDYFLARRDGRVVGTIAAILNKRHNEFHQEQAAFFGAFELLPDPEAGVALLEQAGAWAQEHQATQLLGPETFSTNDECGLLIEGFDSPPVMLMTYNPAYYLDVLAQAGFTKAMDLWAWIFDIPLLFPDGQLPERIARIGRKVKERYRLTIRELDMSQWPKEVEQVKVIYNQAWEQNWGFVPLTDAEIEHLANSLKPILRPELALFVEVDGEPVGFVLNLPDVNQPLLRIRPGPSQVSSYLAGVRLLRQKTETDLVRNFALGVIPAYRRRGVDALLYAESIQRSSALGYQRAEASWILENNDAMNRPIAALGGKVYKKYRIYQKDLT